MPPRPPPNGSTHHGRACKNVSCECEFETIVTLAPGARAATVHATLRNARADATDYGAFAQELPALYGIGDLHVLRTYRGGAPWTNAPAESLDTPQPQPPWAPGQISITEGWAAFVDASDAVGWGFYSPRYATALAGFHGKPAGNASQDSCGYFAPTAAVDLTHDVVFSYDFAVVLGASSEVRAYAYAAHAAAAAAAVATPYADWSSARARHEWVVAAGERLRVTGSGGGGLYASSAPRGASHHAVRLVGPPVPWDAATAPALELRVAAAGHGATASGAACAPGAAAAARVTLTFVRAGEPVFGDAALAPLLAASAERVARTRPRAPQSFAPQPPPPRDGYGGALAAGAGGPARAATAMLPLACGSPALGTPLTLELARVPGYNGLLLQLQVDIEADEPFTIAAAGVDIVRSSEKS